MVGRGCSTNLRTTWLSLCPREVLCFLTGQGCHSESFVDCGQVENEGSDLTSGAKRGEKLQRETAESEEGKRKLQDTINTGCRCADELTSCDLARPRVNTRA